MKRKLLLLASFLSLGVSASPWEKLTQPSSLPSESVGSYANGCLVGAAALPLKGEGYQVLRSQRDRYFGHPNTIAFIERLSHFAQQDLHTNLLIGDLSLPQGGRFSSGHTSHQTGLDADIWLRFADEKLPPEKLAEPKAMSLVNLEQYKLRKSNWDQRHFELVKAAASDQEVVRIFVHPVIKEKLCQSEKSSDRGWLRKVRPWWGHHYHMHVRLKCPQGSTQCLPQAAPPAGDGCGAELASWKPQPKPVLKTTNTATKPKKKKPKVMPAMCQTLLDQSHSR
ncbi:penicillin-insensitive murein endopeptidase [Vibrio sp. TRT 17S01]|uniref:penicillin-insensitive murein endopeptidase n=1 Tax=Vibrio sp. TRT 17S01 TaxID=3418505 RepID=UPI003CE85EEB